MSVSAASTSQLKGLGFRVSVRVGYTRVLQGFQAPISAKSLLFVLHSLANQKPCENSA